MNWKQYKFIGTLALFAYMLIACAGMQTRRPPRGADVQVPVIGVAFRPDIGETLEVTGSIECHARNQSANDKPMMPCGALKAGIRKGDVIEAINGEPVRNNSEIVAVIQRYRPGDMVQVTVKRNGRKINFDVQLGSMYMTSAQYEIRPMVAAMNDVLSEKKPVRLSVYMGQISNTMADNKLQLEEWKKGIEPQVLSDAEKTIIQTFGYCHNFSLVDRYTLQEIADEHKLTMSGMISRETRTKLGEILGLTHVVVIDYFRGPYGRKSIHDAETVRLIEIDTGRVLQSARINYYFIRR